MRLLDRQPSPKASRHDLQILLDGIDMWVIIAGHTAEVYVRVWGWMNTALKGCISLRAVCMEQQEQLLAQGHTPKSGMQPPADALCTFCWAVDHAAPIDHTTICQRSLWRSTLPGCST